MTTPRDFPMLIDGALVESESKTWLDVTDPADESVIGRVPAGTSTDVNRAIAAAKAAWPAWAALDVRERARQVRGVAQALRARTDEILDIEVRDTGNTIARARADVAGAGDTLDFYAGLATEMKGETVPASADNLHFTILEPYGVVARIIPFNHPIKFAANALAAPLIAGNCVVLKTPDTSPLSAGILAEICQELLPAGVVSILSGQGNIVGDAIVRHCDIKRIGFTGSVPTGMAIQKAAAESGVKAVTLELGGKNPMIVFPDMVPAEIAKAAVAGMSFAWQGQSCGSMSRVFLHDDIHDETLTEIVRIVSNLRLGSPREEASQMGPVNSEAHYHRILRLIETGRNEGARLLTGGKRPPGYDKGYWIEPTVFANVTPDMTIAREEIFGPVMSIIRWRDEADVIRMANDSDLGLTASIWTREYGAAMRMVRSIRSGYIWVNGASRHFYGTPFGGFGNSGVGREEGLSELLSYTETKTVHLMDFGQ